MGLFQSLFGRRTPARQWSAGTAVADPPAPPVADAQALARYRYLLRTAPPETIEQAHAEAFARLTPEQRLQVQRELAEAAPPAERGRIDGNSPDPHTLARLATRAELRQPGTLERAFGAPGGGFGGPGMGGMMAGTIFGSLVAGFVGSLVAQQFMESMPDLGPEGASADAGAAAPADDLGADSGLDQEFGGFDEF